MTGPRTWLNVGRCLAVAAALSGGSAVVDAQSGEIAPLVDTINRLERQIRALERTVYRGDAPPPLTATSSADVEAVGNAPQLQVRLGQFEEEVRSLTGRVERIGFDVRQLSGRLDKLVVDVDFRLRMLEQGGVPSATGETNAGPLEAAAPIGSASASAALPAQPATAGVVGQLTESQLRAQGVEPNGRELARASPSGATVSEAVEDVVLPEGTAEDQYNFARNFLMQRDYGRAEAALQIFVESNAGSRLAGNAQYWLGETYYVRNDFIRAAQTFAEGYQTYPDSSKAPDNLLKLGLSLANLERTEDACLTLSKLRSEYPEAPANILQRAQREFGRLSCS